MEYRFFNDLQSLDRFTMELDRYHDSLQCSKCSRSGQFVSHGYVYRQMTQKTRVTVGKRIFCSNRHGRTGCGGTLRLYLDTFIPMLRYDTTHMTVFLKAMISGLSIKKAYLVATRADEPRNAYRWLQKLQYQITSYRGFLQTRAHGLAHAFRSRTRRLQILLPTIQRLSASTQTNLCRSYQSHSQTSFI